MVWLEKNLETMSQLQVERLNIVNVDLRRCQIGDLYPLHLLPRSALLLTLMMASNIHGRSEFYTQRLELK